MTKTKKIWIGAGTLAGAAALTVGGVSTAFAGDSAADGEKNDHDTPLTGTTLTQASDAAVKAAGGGKVTESEVSDEGGSAYEVTVLLPDGQEVEVQLDKSFTVLSQETEAAESENEANEGPETGNEANEGPETGNEANDTGAPATN